jgi:hypothetical protein
MNIPISEEARTVAFRGVFSFNQSNAIRSFLSRNRLGSWARLPLIEAETINTFVEIVRENSNAVIKTFLRMDVENIELRPITPNPEIGINKPSINLRCRENGKYSNKSPKITHTNNTLCSGLWFFSKKYAPGIININKGLKAINRSENGGVGVWF